MLLKDRVGVAQLLLLPTARVTGIEDPALQSPAAPNYFERAWQAVPFVRALTGRNLPPDALSLASTRGLAAARTNCTSMSIACVRTSAPHCANTPPRWPTPGRRFPWRLPITRIWRAGCLTLDRPGATPFQLAAEIPGAAADPGALTLVVAPVMKNRERAFVLLAGRADAATGNPGSGEELQDHACAVARTPLTDAPPASSISPR